MIKTCSTLVLALMLFQSGFSQTKDSLKTVHLITEVTLSTRNIWRGLDYGSSPSIQGTLAVRKDFIEAGAFGTTTLNGSKTGYGTWMELYATAYWKNWSFTVDDYFFFNELDADNNYFEWGHDNTQHIIEGRVKYATSRFSVMGGYALYKNRFDKTTGLYLESEYFFTPNFSFILAGLTDESWLSFYRKGGITTIGFTGRRELAITKNYELLLKASLIANPSYERSLNAPGVGTNPVYFVISLTF